MIKLIQSGLSSNAIISNLIFSGFISFFIWGISIAGAFGMFAIPALVVLVPWFVQYCFDTGSAAVYGAAKPPVHKFKSFLIKPLIFTLICYGLYALTNVFFGKSAAIIISSLILPALISTFLVEEELFETINPVHWLRYLVLLKINYLVLSMILAIAALLLMLIPSGLWLWPKLFVYQTILVGTFFSIGQLLHENRVELNILTPENESERNIRETSERDTAEFNKHTDRWHRLSEVHQYKKALQEILQYLATTTDRLEYAFRIMDELLVWRNPALGAKFIPHYVQILIEHNKPAKAFGVYQNVVERYGPIPLELESSRRLMAQFASEAGNYQLEKDLTY